MESLSVQILVMAQMVLRGVGDDAGSARGLALAVSFVRAWICAMVLFFGEGDTN